MWPSACFGVVGGLVLSAMFNLPPSFFVVSLVFVVWLVTLAATGRRRSPAAALAPAPAPTDVVGPTPAA